MPRRTTVAGIAVLATLAITGCEYVRMLRPSVLKQLNPRVVRLVNTLPDIDRQNEAIVARLVAHGGLSYAEFGRDSIARVTVRAPRGQFIWEPSIIVMARGGVLEIDFSNEDDFVPHAAFLPSNGGQQIVWLPTETRGRARLQLNEPGLYFFGCPVANHAGRGMLGLIMVKGDVPPEAKLDRPRQARPRSD